MIIQEKQCIILCYHNFVHLVVLNSIAADVEKRNLFLDDKNSVKTCFLSHLQNIIIDESKSTFLIVIDSAITVQLSLIS